MTQPSQDCILFDRFADGEAGPEEIARINGLLEHSRAHRTLFRRRMLAHQVLRSSLLHVAGCAAAAPRARPRTWIRSIMWLLAGTLIVTAGIMFIPDPPGPPQKYLVSDARGLRIRGESRLVAPQEVLAAGTVLETGMAPQDGAIIDLDGRCELRLRPLARVRLAEPGGIHSLESGVVGVRSRTGATQAIEAPRLGRLEISGLAWLSIGSHRSEAVVLEGSAMVLGRRIGASTSLIVDDQGRCSEGNLDLEQHGEVWIDRTVLAGARMGKWTPPSSSVLDESALDHRLGTAGVEVAQGRTVSIPLGVIGESGRFQGEIGMNNPSDDGFTFTLGRSLDLATAIGDPVWPRSGGHVSLQRGSGTAKFQSIAHLAASVRRVGWNNLGPIHQIAMRPGSGSDGLVLFHQNDPCILTLEVTGKTTAELMSYSFSGCLGQSDPPAP